MRPWLTRAALSVLTAVACLLAGACGDGDDDKPPAPLAYWSIDEPDIVELSGIAAATNAPGLWWVHSDDGDAIIFAVDSRGGVVARVRLLAADNQDWEDIAVDSQGRLYVCDCGNNANNRTDLVVYRLIEPDATAPSLATAVGIDASFHFSYPEQTALPDPDDLNYDAEALWVDGDDMWLLTKGDDDTTTRLYRLDGSDAAAESESPQQAQLVASTTLSAAVTGADIHPTTGQLAVLTKAHVYTWAAASDPALLFDGPLNTVHLDRGELGDVEGITWDPTSSGVVLVNEAAEFFRMPDPRDPAMTAYP